MNLKLVFNTLKEKAFNFHFENFICFFSGDSTSDSPLYINPDIFDGLMVCFYMKKWYFFAMLAFHIPLSSEQRWFCCVAWMLSLE